MHPFHKQLRRLPRVLITPIGLLVLGLGLGALVSFLLRSPDVVSGSVLFISVVIVALGLVQVFTVPPNPPFAPRSIGTSRLIWLLKFLVGTIVVVASGYIGAWSSIYLGNDIKHRQASGSFDLLVQILAVALTFGSLIILGMYCFELVRAKPPARAQALDAIIGRGREDRQWLNRPLAEQWVSTLSSNDFLWFFAIAGFFVAIGMVIGLGWLAAAIPS